MNIEHYNKRSFFRDYEIIKSTTKYNYKVNMFGSTYYFNEYWAFGNIINNMKCTLKRINLEEPDLFISFVIDDKNNICIKYISPNGMYHVNPINIYNSVVNSRHKFEQAVLEDGYELCSRYSSNKDVVYIDYKCGHGAQPTRPNSYLQIRKKHKPGCPICNSRKIIPYVNDVFTKNKDLLKYFVNIKDSIGIGVCDVKHMKYKCPICGSTKNTTLKEIHINGFNCPVCGDGISYPNKFVRSVLSQLDINFTPEYFLDGRRFDNYFCHMNTKYLIEVDGGQHYYGGFGRSKDEIQEIDKIKDKIAIKNNYKLIRIPAIESNKRYLKESILNSELSKIYDLTFVNWDMADKEGMNNYISIVANLWKNREQFENASDIAKKINCNVTSVIDWLRKADEIGLCTYRSNYGRVVYCENLNIYFKSIKEASEYFQTTQSNIGRACRKHYRALGNTFRFATNKEADNYLLSLD